MLAAPFTASYLSILIAAGRPPILAVEICYHSDPKFQGLFEPK